MKEPSKEEVLDEIVSSIEEFKKINNYLENYGNSAYYNAKIRCIAFKITKLLPIIIGGYGRIRIRDKFPNLVDIDFSGDDVSVNNSWNLIRGIFSKRKLSYDEVVVFVFLNLDKVNSFLREEVKKVNKQKEDISLEKKEASEILKPFIVLEGM